MLFAKTAAWLPRLSLDLPFTSTLVFARLQHSIRAWSQKLSIVDSGFEEEMSKPWDLRQQDLLFLLYRERYVCETVISELQQVMSDLTSSD